MVVMNVLVIGAGGVGSALVAIAARRPFFTSLTIADVDPVRARRAAELSGDCARVRPATVNASDRAAIVELARACRADVIVNACDTRFNRPIFDASFEAGCHYLDLAMHPSIPHPTAPYRECGVKLGDEQFAVSAAWEQRGLLAVGGIGVEPGLSDIFARYAADHLFSRIDEIGVRDGSNLSVDGYEFAPTFSIWTTIEECLAPPVVFERNRGWFTTEPFSEPEVFTFPGGIGDVECVNVEHEEVLLIPRWIDCDRVTFKYGLGREFIEVLRTLHKLGLDSTKPVRVGDSLVSPRALVAATLPNPADLGDRMHGKTCAGTWVTGLGRDGLHREVYLHHLVDNSWSMNEYGHQAVVWQTAVNPVIALELMSAGSWNATGVVGPEAFDAVPFLDLLNAYGSPWALQDRTRVAAAA
jgi:saccharopine dehydrogenase (NAD+, L-lysine forming)